MKNKMFMTMLGLLGMLGVVKAQIENFARSSIAGDAAKLLANKSVQEELKMDKEQITKVGEWAMSFVGKANEIKKNKGLFRGVFNPTPEQRIELMEKMGVAMSEINKVSFKELSSILRKEQIERLKQIYFQDRSIRTFLLDDVITALNLTDKQLDSLKQVRNDYEKTLMNYQREEPEGRDISEKERLEYHEKRNTKIRELMKEYLGKSIALLDGAQKKRWKEMTGEPFDLEKLRLPIQVGKN